MKPELQNKLKKQFPKLIKCGIECDDGWYDLIYNLSECIQTYADNNTNSVEQPEVSQIKEKFGGLRYYTTGDIRIFGMVWFAEHLSFKICEKCGKQGKLRNNGWYLTLCEECNNEKEDRRKKSNEEFNAKKESSTKI